VKTLAVDEESAGQRLDNFLMRHLKGVPKTHVYRIIRSGEVRVNKGRASADQRVVAGDLVRLPPVRISAQVAAKADSPAPAREFPVLMEDEALLRRARPASLNLELVHRLDRETSGVLLVAKKRSALKHLQDQFRDRETGKTYLALVLGLWPSNKKVIDAPLHKYIVEKGDGEGERRVKVVGKDDPNGMRSITLVRVARTVGPYSLLEVTIKTGRTHQIRVHLASQGHPIAGDDKYGDFEHNKQLQKLGLKRMFLHAWQLKFQHPQSGRPITLQAPLPPELQNFVDSIQPPIQSKPQDF
jgi:23S rRNA pseudouridine955/2504/2580 synthase